MNNLLQQPASAIRTAIILIWSCCCTVFAGAQDYSHPRVDVQHYTFSLVLNDDNNSIKGEAVVTVVFVQPSTTFDLDLVKKSDLGKGMAITSITKNNQPVSFTHDAEQVHISSTGNTGDTASYTIVYEGIPADGLIIDKTKFGHRSFFGDNWPNRAHNWLPCIDNPADKAAVDFIVTAPEHYQVVANGLQVEENNLPNHLKQTHWKETVALPTKVMTIGAADFAVNYAGSVDCIPVYSWVYPENKEKGFYDYALAKDILPFFIQHVGPYAYQKLANVQSKTKFGGLENANTISYFENSVQGDRKVEALLTHEIAHQWFGNSATEKSWPHIWLSESFATYMTHLYLENKYGVDTLHTRLLADRKKVIAYSKKKTAPVVDTSITSNFMQLLNPNSYEKGGWVLHMLRRKLGDTIFWQGIRLYYAQFSGKNAVTADLEKAFETVSGQDLQAFFQQWIFSAGHPVLRVSSRYNSKKKTVTVSIEQLQNKLFNFPLVVEVANAGVKQTKSIEVKDKTRVFSMPSENAAFTVTLDPGVNLLFEEAGEKQK